MGKPCQCSWFLVPGSWFVVINRPRNGRLANVICYLCGGKCVATVLFPQHYSGQPKQDTELRMSFENADMANPAYQATTAMSFLSSRPKHAKVLTRKLRKEIIRRLFERKPCHKPYSQHAALGDSRISPAPDSQNRRPPLKGIPRYCVSAQLDDSTRNQHTVLF